MQHHPCSDDARDALASAATVPVLALVIAVCTSNCPAASSPMSEIKPDEQVVFFPTAARQSPDGKHWLVPIHGWIYEPQENQVVRKALLGALGRGLGRSGLPPIDEHRVGLFLVDNERGKRISIQLGDQVHVLDASGPNGHFTHTIQLSLEAARGLAGDGPLRFHAVSRDDDSRRFAGVAHLVSATGISVISDIDDTIKITEATDTAKTLANTFFGPFRAVEGMEKVYRRWAEAGVVFHYVSSSPWQLYGPLSDFMRQTGFPDGSFHLKHFRIKDSSFWDLLADPGETKAAFIEPILAAYPKRQFVLVGDSGQKDPELYGQIARQHPDQVLRIYIRDVTGEPADSPRYEEAFRAIPRDKWLLFDDPQQLTFSPTP